MVQIWYRTKSEHTYTFLEYIPWILGEDLSLKNDGSIIRHITTKGKGWKNPNEGALVKGKYQICSDQPQHSVMPINQSIAHKDISSLNLWWC